MEPDNDNYVVVKRFRINENKEPTLVHTYPENFAYSEHESVRDFIIRFVQKYELKDTFYIWSNRYNIGKYFINKENTIKIRIDPYHPATIGIVHGINIVYKSDVPAEIQQNITGLFDYKINIYNWTTETQPTPIEYTLTNRFDSISKLLQKISDFLGIKGQIPYIWKSLNGKNITPFGFSMETPRWKGYNINPWKAILPDLNKPGEYDPVPHITYHTTDVPLGYIEYDLNVVFPEYFINKKDFIILNPYYFQYFPICATPITPVSPPVYVNHKNKIKVINNIFPDDNFLTVHYKVAEAFNKQELPFLFASKGKDYFPVGHNIEVSKRSISTELYNRVYKEYNTLVLKPDEIPTSAPTVQIIDNRNYKFIYNLNALFPSDFKEKNVNFIKNFFPEDYISVNLKNITVNDKVINNLIYKKPIKDHYDIIDSKCTYNRLIYEGYIPKIGTGEMSFADIFDIIPTSLAISMVQWIDDRGRVLYKVFKNHNIPEHIFEEWTSKENIKKRYGLTEKERNYCVNLYGMLPNLTNAYFVVSFRESGIFTIKYDIGKRDITNYMNLYEHQKRLTTRLNQYMNFKLKSYLNKIEVTSYLILYEPSLTIDYIIKRFNNYDNVIFKNITKITENGEKIYGEFMRSDASAMNFILKIVRDNNSIEVYIKDAPSMTDIRRSMHYIRSILLLNPLTDEEKKKPVKAALDAARTKPIILKEPEEEESEESEAEEEEESEEDELEKLARTGGVREEMSGGANGIVITRLKDIDKTIFNSASLSTNPSEKYARACQNGQQPFPVKNDLMEKIKKHPHYKNIGSDVPGFINSIKFGSDPNNKYNLICPLYWCEKSNIPLAYKNNKCPDPKEKKIVITKKPYVYIKPKQKLVLEDKKYDIPCCGELEKEKTKEIYKKSMQVSQDADYHEIPKIITTYIPKQIDSHKIEYVSKGTDISVSKYIFIGINIPTKDDPFMETIAYVTNYKTKYVLMYNIKKILTPTVFISLENGAVFSAFADPVVNSNPTKKQIKKAIEWCEKDKIFTDVFKPATIINRIVAIYESYLKYINYLEYSKDKSPYLLFDLMRHLGVFLSIWEYDKNKDMAEASVDLFCPYYRSANSIINKCNKFVLIGKYIYGDNPAQQYEAMAVFKRKSIMKQKVEEEEETILETNGSTEKTKKVLDKIETENETVYVRLDKTSELTKLIQKCPSVEQENEVESFLPKFLAQRKNAWEGILDINLRLVYIRSSADQKWASLPVPIPIGYLPDYISSGLKRLYYQEEAAKMANSPTFAPITQSHIPKMIVSNTSKYVNELYEAEKNKQIFWYKFQHLFAQWLYINYDLPEVKKAREIKNKSERIQKLFDILKKYTQMPMTVKEISNDYKQISKYIDEIENAQNKHPIIEEWLNYIKNDDKAEIVTKSFEQLLPTDKKQLEPIYKKVMTVFKLRKRVQNMQRITDMTEKDYKAILEIGIEELPIISKNSLLRWIRDHQAMERYPFFSMEVRENPREYIFSQGAVEEQVVLPMLYSKKSMNFSDKKEIHAEEYVIF